VAEAGLSVVFGRNGECRVVETRAWRKAVPSAGRRKVAAMRAQRQVGNPRRPVQVAGEASAARAWGTVWRKGKQEQAESWVVAEQRGVVAVGAQRECVSQQASCPS